MGVALCLALVVGAAGSARAESGNDARTSGITWLTQKVKTGQGSSAVAISGNWAITTGFFGKNAYLLHYKNNQWKNVQTISAPDTQSDG
ncbi:MAG: hypothetical protein ACRESR_07980, partial [Gammaproteobacteria bacterium]